jgi:starch synthase
MPDQFKEKFSSNFAKKLRLTGIPSKCLTHFRSPGYDQITQLAVDYADAVALTIDTKKKILTYVEQSGKPVLQHPDDDNYVDLYDEFYDQILAEPSETE